MSDAALVVIDALGIPSATAPIFGKMISVETCVILANKAAHDRIKGD